jgi:hypothetical protein
MNPFGDFNLKNSTWPMLLFMYNLPPWLMTIFFDYVVPHHPREGIHEGCEHGHIHGTFD